MAAFPFFRRKERFPALGQARDYAEAQAGQVAQQAGQVAQLVAERLPWQRRRSFWSRFSTPLIAVAAAVAAVAAIALFATRQRADAAVSSDETPARGLAADQTETYDAQRAATDGGNVDVVQQAVKESFPASDAPPWGSGPDVPIIREGEHKEALPYQQP